MYNRSISSLILNRHNIVTSININMDLDIYQHFNLQSMTHVVQLHHSSM